MIEDLYTKLSNALNKPIEEEVQVVYILSCIRKIIEIEGETKRSQNKKLKFFCDWALHSRIDRIGAFETEIVKLSSNKNIKARDVAGIIGLEHFIEEFVDFLSQHGLPSISIATGESRKKIQFILAHIYKDVPLIVREVRETQIKITNIVDKPTFQIGFRIVYPEIKKVNAYKLKYKRKKKYKRH